MIALRPRNASVCKQLIRCGAFVTVLLIAAGCSQEEKVVRYHPFLANLPDAKTGLAPVGDRFGNAALPNAPSAEDAERMVDVNPDGTVRLRSSNIRQLMSQVVSCLQKDELELLHDQLVSKSTHEEYRERGKDSFAFVEHLYRNQDAIVEMFKRMPMAENTPAVAMHQPARNTFKLQLTGIAKNGLKWTTMWVTHESGTWKIMWME